MRGVHRGVITLELVISLGLMATLCAAIMPSIYCDGEVGTHIVPACGGQFHVPFHSRFPYGKR